LSRSLSALCLVLAASLCPAQGPQKKIIEWGWDEPDTEFLRANVGKMEELPFDGLVFHVTGSRGGNFTWEMWGSRKFELVELQKAIDNLKATRFKRLSERFLRVNVTPGDVDWFDDEAWAVVLNNYALAAQVAQQGGARGFMFDVEQYQAAPFDYAQQKHHDEKSFDAYRQQVRKRGRQWVEAVNRHFPDITILLTFGYRVAQPPPDQDRSASHYGLLADFLDGVLDGCTDVTRIVDAWEYAYPYKQPSQFQQAYATIKQEALDWTAVPQRYGRQVEAGFGIWMDCRWRQLGWNLDDFSKNYFTPAEFEASVRAALATSDRYVWIYTEQSRWWTNQRLPGEYVKALANARKSPPAESTPESAPKSTTGPR